MLIHTFFNYYVASSVSGQVKPNLVLLSGTRADRSCLLGITRCVPQEMVPRKPYNISFIDQSCSVNMAGYWPRSFFFARLWPSSQHTKKERGQYPASKLGQ